MNTVKQACLRKKLIISHLIFFRFLTTSQIQSLAFCFPSGRTKAQAVLKSMRNAHVIKGFREHEHGEFVYHLCRKTPDWQSVLALNRLYFAIAEKGKNIYFQPEMEFFSGRCDGFFVAEYRGKRKKFFVEVDRATAPFKKADIYNILLQTAWEAEPWADPLKNGVISFPLIVVLTIRREIVQKDFMKAQFKYFILDLYEPKWEKIFI